MPLAHVAVGAVGYACSGFAEQINFAIAHVDTMGMPDIVASPAQRPHIFHRPSAKSFQAKFLFFQRFGQVGMQTDAILAGQIG